MTSMVFVKFFAYLVKVTNGKAFCEFYKKSHQ